MIASMMTLALPTSPGPSPRRCDQVWRPPPVSSGPSRPAAQHLGDVGSWPPAAAPGFSSKAMTRMPPCADTCMMPRPIEPVPTTPIVTSAAWDRGRWRISPVGARRSYCSNGRGRWLGKTRAVSWSPGNSARPGAAVSPVGPRSHDDHRGGRYCPPRRSALPAQARAARADRARAEIAGRGPSGSHMQPWKVGVLVGGVRRVVREGCALRPRLEGGWSAIWLLSGRLARALTSRAGVRFGFGRCKAPGHRPRRQTSMHAQPRAQLTVSTPRSG